MANPSKFVREIRQETDKVTWPTRKETMISTAMVLVMVLIASIFFLVVDNIIQYIVGLLLGV
jgi:preprotein translocase subunit SecE